MKNIAIVTGASSGLGKEFVRLITKKRGIDEIWAIARNEQKLQRLAIEMGIKVKTFSKDLSDLKQVKSVGALLENSSYQVQYLVNNAGFAKFCSYKDLSVDESLNMIDLNIRALVAMGLICLPYMPKGAHLINIASQASFFPLPYQNIYSSTKAFVRHYTRALNVELKDKGVSATAVCPGWISTGLFERGLIGAEKATNNFYGMVQPDVVAKKALRDADRNKDISIYGLYVKSTHVLSKILPQKAIMSLWLKQQKLK